MNNGQYRIASKLVEKIHQEFQGFHSEYRDLHAPSRSQPRTDGVSHAIRTRPGLTIADGSTLGNSRSPEPPLSKRSAMMHDPTRLTDGIEPSYDPVLAVRRGVYEVSVAYRTGGWKGRLAAWERAGACPFGVSN